MSEENKTTTLTDEDAGNAAGGYGSAANGKYHPVATGAPCTHSQKSGMSTCAANCKYNEDERGSHYVRVCTLNPK